ncbi:HemK methyltransferase member 2, partial [Globomyces sp. JEL0801]
YLAVDINPQACDISFRTGSQNNVSVDLVNTNFTDGLNKRLHGTIDVLCFNPPYVVTPTEEIGSKSIEASWAGGIDGREVIDRFLPLVDVQ